MVSHSSVKSEYFHLALTTTKIIWLTHLFRDLQINLAAPPTINYDNKSTIFMSSNAISQAHSKYIGLDYHFIR